MNGLLPCCSDALTTRVVLIFTTAGDAFSIMSANELESWLTCWWLWLVSARATTEIGELAREATAKAAISPPPIEAATSARIAVVRRNWITFDISLEILSYSRPTAALLILDALNPNSIYKWQISPRNGCLLPFLVLLGTEGQARTFRAFVNRHCLAGLYLSTQQQFGKRSFNFPLDGPFQRT